MKLSLIIGFAFVVAVMAIVGLGIGVEQEGLSPPMLDSNPTWIDQFTYVFANIGFLFQMMAYNISGVPAEVQLLLITPFVVGLGYVIVKLIRGGG